MQDLKFLSKDTKLTNYSVIPNELFGLGISSTAMILYAKLLNRSNLSISTGQIDDAGKVYIFYKIEDLAKELGRGLSAIKININELVAAGLIEKRRADKGRANIIYVKVPASSVVGKKVTYEGVEKQPYNGSKSAFLGGRYVTPNNYSNNTKIITNYDFQEGESL